MRAVDAILAVDAPVVMHHERREDSRRAFEAGWPTQLVYGWIRQDVNTDISSLP